MAVVDVLKVFQALKRGKVIRDYMIFGSVAAMVHTRPFYTNDVDIAIAVDSDREYLEAFNKLTSMGRVKGHAIVINNTALEVFPVNISPVLQDALEHALRKRVEGIVVKVAPAEHLLLEALRVHRTQDRARVLILDDIVDRRNFQVCLRGLTMMERSSGVTKGLLDRLIKDQERRAEQERKLSFAKKLRILDALQATPITVEDISED